ncbi:MAG: ATP-binding cassette domain-containing protein [Pirellulales bacterium]
MPLVTLRDLTVRFRGPPLLDGVSCLIEPGDRIGLLGRNGTGKTTLMRILSGEQTPDHGDVVLAPGVHVAYLPQDVPAELQGRVADVVAAGAVGRVSTPDELPHPETGLHWQTEQSVTQILRRMELDGERPFEALSSGMKRRVLLARALVSQPDFLLLDEPTNHLDVDAITWLEDFLARWPGTYMFVTHDRVFLQRLAGRIWELDRGRLFDWSCDYETFLARKEAALAAEEKQNALFDKKLAEEEVWIRQGIKARRTRNEGRVRALEEMRRERRERRDAPGKVRLEIQEAQRSGTLVAQLTGVSFSYGDRPIFRDFSTTVLRGDRVGIIGPNGAGKSTLLKVLLGILPPDSGTVRLGTQLQIAYFDQLREQLDDNRSVQDNVGDGYDTVRVGGQSRHIVGYLRDFLFSAERARTPVRFLSGGERNRVLLARLFAKPANVIVLDEPTNDLDSETLELLEQQLIEFSGTVLVVSHDRAFLNNVVTTSLVFEAGGVKEYVGGYDDWLRQRPPPATPAPTRAPADTSRSAPPSPATTSSTTTRRLSFKEKQELAALPARISALETEIADFHAAFAQPDYFRRPGEQLAREQARLAAAETELAAALERWLELEERAAASGG